MQAPETVRQRPWTLEEIAAEAPFRVFAPPELPEGDWRLHAHYHPERRRPPVGATAALIYHRADGRGAIVLTERAADGEEPFSWSGLEEPEREEVERDGVRYTLARGKPELGGQSSVSFVREGTALQIQSQELDVETLLELAASLRALDK